MALPAIEAMAAAIRDIDENFIIDLLVAKFVGDFLLGIQRPAPNVTVR